MDIRCRYCREPWELDHIHDEAEAAGTTFKSLRAKFSQMGCVALGGQDCRKGRTPSAVVDMLTGLLGDDVDGLACELEDAAAIGLLDD
jgi:hypothetical protein